MDRVAGGALVPHARGDDGSDEPSETAVRRYAAALGGGGGAHAICLAPASRGRLLVGIARGRGTGSIEIPGVVRLQARVAHRVQRPDRDRRPSHRWKRSERARCDGPGGRRDITKASRSGYKSTRQEL